MRYKKEAFKIKLSENIKKFRMAKGISQNELAKNICEQSQISNLERGETMPTAFVMHGICKKLGISMEALLEESVFDYIYKMDEFKVEADYLVRKNDEIALNNLLVVNAPSFKEFGKEGEFIKAIYYVKLAGLNMKKKIAKKSDFEYIKSSINIFKNLTLVDNVLYKITLANVLIRISIHLEKFTDVSYLLSIVDKMIPNVKEGMASQEVIRYKVNLAIYNVHIKEFKVTEIYLNEALELCKKYSNINLMIIVYNAKAFSYARRSGEDNRILCRTYHEKAINIAKLVSNENKVVSLEKQLKNI